MLSCKVLPAVCLWRGGTSAGAVGDGRCLLVPSDEVVVVENRLVELKESESIAGTNSFFVFTGCCLPSQQFCIISAVVTSGVCCVLSLPCPASPHGNAYKHHYVLTPQCSSSPMSAQLSPTFQAVTHNQVLGYLTAFMGGQIITWKNTLEVEKAQRSATKMVKGLECLPSEEPWSDEHPSSLKRGMEKDKRSLNS